MSRLPQRQIPKGPYIELNVSTWSKDSHALYDYETTDNKFYNQTFYISNSSKVYRHITTMRTNIQNDNDTRQLPVENIYIGTLIQQNGKFQFQSATVSGIKPHIIIRQDHPDLFNNSFVVIRDFPNGYALTPGNIIRLGRIQYCVLQIRNKQQTKTYKQTTHMEINKGTHLVTSHQNYQGSCKVCLCEESTIDDPLIAPCQCKGSCELIHVHCLKNWIYSKVKKEVNGIAHSYNFSKYQCEICKTLFPKYIKLQNSNEIDMINIDKPNKPYIILESLADKSQSKEERNLHLISLEDNSSLKLGRGNQCQIRITDISVSRTHAQIKYQNGQFYIKDLCSKFVLNYRQTQSTIWKDCILIQYQKQKLNYHNRTMIYITILPSNYYIYKQECMMDT